MIYKTIPSYEGIYEISESGQVRSLNRVIKTSRGQRTYKGQALKSYKDKNGYLYTQLWNNGYIKTIKIHQLVAMAFLGHKPNGYKLVVDHIDRNKLNNHFTNLRLVNQRENANNRDRSKNASIYAGVSYCKQTGKYKARLTHENKVYWLGRHDTELQASKAYEDKLKEIQEKFKK